MDTPTDRPMVQLDTVDGESREIPVDDIVNVSLPMGVLPTRVQYRTPDSDELSFIHVNDSPSVVYDMMDQARRPPSRRPGLNVWLETNGDEDQGEVGLFIVHAGQASAGQSIVIGEATCDYREVSEPWTAEIDPRFAPPHGHSVSADGKHHLVGALRHDLDPAPIQQAIADQAPPVRILLDPNGVEDHGNVERYVVSRQHEGVSRAIGEATHDVAGGLAEPWRVEIEPEHAPPYGLSLTAADRAGVVRAVSEGVPRTLSPDWADPELKPGERAWVGKLTQSLHDEQGQPYQTELYGYSVMVYPIESEDAQYQHASFSLEDGRAAVAMAGRANAKLLGGLHHGERAVVDEVASDTHPHLRDPGTDVVVRAMKDGEARLVDIFPPARRLDAFGLQAALNGEEAPTPAMYPNGPRLAPEGRELLGAATAGDRPMELPSWSSLQIGIEQRAAHLAMRQSGSRDKGPSLR